MLDLPLLICDWLLDRNISFVHHSKQCSMARSHTCLLYTGGNLFIIYQNDKAISGIILENEDLIVLYFEGEPQDLRYTEHFEDIREVRLWVGRPEWDKTLYSLISGEKNGTRYS